MARYRRARVAGGTYFFTVVTERRQRVLVLPEVRAALRAAIENVRVARPFEIKPSRVGNLLPTRTALIGGQCLPTLHRSPLQTALVLPRGLACGPIGAGVARP